MPDSNNNYGAWAAAGNAVNQLANTISVNKSTRADRRYADKVYSRTKQDNLDFWNMTNAYNSPKEQMSRFTAAGLNPNLIYGSAGDNSAANIPTPDVLPVQHRAPKLDIDPMAELLMRADLRIKQAQADNLEEQTDVIRSDAALRDWQAKRAGFDFDFVNEMRGVTADGMRESVRQKRISSDLAINEDARRAISNASSVSEAAERIASMIEQRKGFEFERGKSAAETARIAQDIRNMQRDGRLKDFEIRLNDSNISKSDPLWQRMVADFLSGNSSLLKKIQGLPKGTNFHPDLGPK